MAKELFIVFLYDTEVRLREEEDPQVAVVYFHPSWVNPNQRMALCGQLIGVTQFLATSFSFPSIISLQSGKFSLKQLGRYILCVGTDRNIPDWILEERCSTLFSTLQFFHNDLNAFNDSTEQKETADKLVNTMQMYLPVLFCAGSYFNNNLTIRLPKSASSIFLEAAQILEWIQTNEGVHGGAIFYQNKIVMSQLSAETTKQIVITDPHRIKIPAESISTPFQLPANVQLLFVYVDDPELVCLNDEKLPNSTHQKLVKSNKNVSESTADQSKWSYEKTSNRAGIFTVVEEESEGDHTAKKQEDLSRMPDLVKDTVRTFKGKPEKKKCFCEIQVESFIVDPVVKSEMRSSCSSENIYKPNSEVVGYYSFDRAHNSEEKSDIVEDTIKSESRNGRNVSRLRYYNTISDPLNPWFHRNGLPASKALHDHRLVSYCQSIDPKNLNEGDQPAPVTNGTTEKSSAKRPTSISLVSESTPKRKNRSLGGLLMDLKREFSGIFTSDSSDGQKTKDSPIQCSAPPESKEIPLTPLMSKLSMLDLSQRSMPTGVTTPTVSVPCITAEKTILPDDVVEKLKRQTRRKKRYQRDMFRNRKHVLKKTTMFVFGHENISVYLLLTEESKNNEDLIKNLCKACSDSIIDLEKHFQQCLNSAPQAQQVMNTTNESYSYLHLHSVWETIQHGGSWIGPHIDLLNTMHSNFTDDCTLMEMTVRMDDSIIYGSQLASNQVFYQQNVPSIAGLPTPSDLMGIVSLKAKRRLERDHSILIV